ncbi:hypothetical protein EB796_024830 [Bugula neritina]|uniref:SVEP1 n=1 Tax=Bugula neritina TaxID=10212 RepID=A0A7J7ITH6_BUGNE|nr:hypothetical protein EB796_024830 [Bugula neritina]
MIYSNQTDKCYAFFPVKDTADNANNQCLTLVKAGGLSWRNGNELNFEDWKGHVVNPSPGQCILITPVRWELISCTAKHSFFCQTSEFTITVGGWSEWTEWSACDVSKSQRRTRQCDNPKPVCSRNCAGDSVETRVCCADPGYGDNAMRVDPTDYIHIGTTLSYRCLEGYKMTNSRTFRNITCGSNGTWSENPPQCVRVLCKSLVQGLYSTLVTLVHNGTYHYEDIAIYVCHEGFIIKGSTNTQLAVECLASGQWSSSVPVNCSDPGFGANTQPPIYIQSSFVKPKATGYFIGDSLLFNCKSEYEIESICEQPPITTRASVVDSLPVYKDDVIEVWCDEGYVANQSTRGIVQTTVCSDNHVFSPDPVPACQPIHCGAPVPGTNVLRRTGSEFFFGSKVVYLCPYGYHDNLTFSPTVSANCTANGTWDHSAVNCERILCEKPGPGIKAIRNDTNDYGYGSITKSNTSSDAAVMATGTAPPTRSAHKYRYLILKVTVGDIFDNRNGTVRAYTLIVCETVEWLAGLSAYDGKLLQKLPTYNDIKAQQLDKITVWPCYQVFEECHIFDRSRECGFTKVQAGYIGHVLTKFVSVSIGSSDCTDQSTDQFCNGPLKEGTTFCVKMRAFTDFDYNDTPCSKASSLESGRQWRSDLLLPLSLSFVPFLVVTVIGLTLLFYKYRNSGVKKVISKGSFYNVFKKKTSDSANVGWRGRAGVAHNSWLQNFNKKRMSGAATESEPDEESFNYDYQKSAWRRHFENILKPELTTSSKKPTKARKLIGKLPKLKYSTFKQWLQKPALPEPTISSDEPTSGYQAVPTASILPKLGKGKTAHLKSPDLDKTRPVLDTLDIHSQPAEPDAQTIRSISDDTTSKDTELLQNTNQAISSAVRDQQDVVKYNNQSSKTSKNNNPKKSIKETNKQVAQGLELSHSSKIQPNVGLEDNTTKNKSSTFNKTRSVSFNLGKTHSNSWQASTSQQEDALLDETTPNSEETEPITSVQHDGYSGNDNKSMQHLSNKSKASSSLGNVSNSEKIYNAKLQPTIKSKGDFEKSKQSLSYNPADTNSKSKSKVADTNSKRGSRIKDTNSKRGSKMDDTNSKESIMANTNRKSWSKMKENISTKESIIKDTNSKRGSKMDDTNSKKESIMANTDRKSWSKMKENISTKDSIIKDTNSKRGSKMEETNSKRGFKTEDTNSKKESIMANPNSKSWSKMKGSISTKESIIKDTNSKRGSKMEESNRKSWSKTEDTNSKKESIMANPNSKSWSKMKESISTKDSIIKDTNSKRGSKMEETNSKRGFKMEETNSKKESIMANPNSQSWSKMKGSISTKDSIIKDTNSKRGSKMEDTNNKKESVSQNLSAATRKSSQHTTQESVETTEGSTSNETGEFKLDNSEEEKLVPETNLENTLEYKTDLNKRNFSVEDS